MTSSARQVRAGKGLVSAAEMADSSALLQQGDLTAAKRRLHIDGYLLLRHFLSAAPVVEVGKGSESA